MFIINIIDVGPIRITRLMLYLNCGVSLKWSFVCPGFVFLLSVQLVAICVCSFVYGEILGLIDFHFCVDYF